MASLGIAGDIVLIVVAGLIGGLVAHRLRQPLLVGYILAGVVVGPNTGGPTVEAMHDIELLAEIGVALLLFALGLELSLRELRLVRRVALIGGPLQILLSAAFGYVVATKLLGLSSRDGIWFGAMISLSSTMVVLKTLYAQGVTTTLASRVMIGLLVVQDLALVPMLALLPRLGTGDDLSGVLLRSLAQAAVFLIVMIVAGTRVIPWILRRVASWESRELFLVTVMALGVGVGYGTYLFGLSFAFGAFVAGLVLSESEFSHQALADIIPLRDVFGLLFFASVGMLFDPRFLLDNLGQVALVVGVIIAGKGLILAVIARSFGYGNMAPALIGLGLCQVGEFSFVLARVGQQSQAISGYLYSLILTSTVLTLVLSPALLKLAPPLHRMWRRIHPKAPLMQTMNLPSPPAGGHVVIAGFGRTGRVVYEALQQAGIPVVVIERSFGSLQQSAIPAVWGDCTSDVVLEAAAVDRARLLVLGMSDAPTVIQTTELAKRLNPEIVILQRVATTEEITDLAAQEIVRRATAHYEPLTP